jgi:lactate dehydrogenase-like 2-hydroxyacid dehydrogenase
LRNAVHESFAFSKRSSIGTLRAEPPAARAMHFKRVGIIGFGAIGKSLLNAWQRAALNQIRDL